MQIHVPDRFKGRGIVTSAGGIAYFTSGYVNLRHIRETLKSDIPIEVVNQSTTTRIILLICCQVFYAGAAELTPEIVAFTQARFEHVRFVDISQAALLHGIPMNGYQIKIWSVVLSSFEEVCRVVMWCDVIRCDVMRCGM